MTGTAISTALIESEPSVLPVFPVPLLKSKHGHNVSLRVN